MRPTISVSGRPKAADHKVAVEKDRCDLGALKQVVEIGVGPIELVDLHAELVVDCLQFLIDRLQFFFRRFKFLVGRL